MKITMSVLAAGLGLSMPAIGLGSSKPGSVGGCSTSAINVASILFDVDGTGKSVPTPERRSRLVHQHTQTPGTDSALSQLQSGSCDWILDLSHSQSRVPEKSAQQRHQLRDDDL